MASITPPTDPLNFVIKGDLDILNALSSDMGDGTIHIRNSGLYVEGLTDLDQTTINTTDGKFNVLGPNKIEFNVSGGATSSVEITAEDTSFFTTTAGTLTLSATATDATGKVSITAGGTGTNSILLDATNATDGQVTIQSAGGDTASSAIRILASDTTDGDVLIQGSGSYASSNPAIKLYADNATSGQILIESAGDAVGSDSIRIDATGTTGGNIAIVGAGSTDPSVLLDATSSSGKIQIQSSGDESAVNSIELLASATTDGNILIQANGTNTNTAAIKLLADNETSGQIIIEADGELSNAIRILADNASGGGIDIDAILAPITIDTTDLTTGITIGTATSGVPVTIGTSTSLTTISGDLVVQGTTTTFNTETLTVEDNIVLINSGNGELGIDSGIVVRRFQEPNGTSAGDVVSSPTPVQESGAFQAGSSTPATLVLAAHASDSDDFYNGWWIKVTSGTGVDQVRRIKDYVGSTKTVTLYVTADNVDPFIDGLDLLTAPAAADTYSLYSDAFSMTFYDESADAWSFANLALTPDAISAGGISTASIQQYQQVNVGDLDVYPQNYDNVFGSASGTVITFTVIGHGLSIGDKLGLSNSTDFTPEITTGTYIVQTVPTANTFTITAPASTTSVAASSASLSFYETSRIRVNVIEPHDAGYGGINIPGLSCSEDIEILKTSTANFNLTACTTTYGAYIMIVSDLNNTNGSFGVFALASSGTGGSVSRIAGSKGADNQRIDARWDSGQLVQLYQSPAGIGAGTYTYRVRIFSSL